MSGALRIEQTEEVVEDVKVVVEELRFERGQIVHGHPAGLGRIVVRLHGGEGCIPQIEVVCVRDGAPAQAAIRMIEDVNLL